MSKDLKKLNKVTRKIKIKIRQRKSNQDISVRLMDKNNTELNINQPHI